MKLFLNTCRVAAFLGTAAVVSACTFGPYVREHDVAQVATPPCFVGDVCAVSFDSVGWTFDGLQTARH